LEDIAAADQPATPAIRADKRGTREPPKDASENPTEYDTFNIDHIASEKPKDSNSGKNATDYAKDSARTNHGDGNASASHEASDTQKPFASQGVPTFQDPFAILHNAASNNDTPIVLNSSSAHDSTSVRSTTSARDSDFRASKVLSANEAGKSDGSKIIVSNLPKDMNKAQIENYFVDWVGPIKNVEISYDQHKVSCGVATITFSQSDSAAKAFAALHGIRLDRMPMSIYIVPSTSSRAPDDAIDSISPSVDASEFPAKGQLPRMSSSTKSTANDGDLGVKNAVGILRITGVVPPLSQSFVAPVQISVPEKDDAYAKPFGYGNESYTPTEEYTKTYPVASKLMLNLGWTPGTGLGPRGGGLKEPIINPNELLDQANKGNSGIGLHQVQVCTKKQKNESKINPKVLAWQQLAKDPKTHDRTIREANRRSETEEPYVLCSVQEIPIPKTERIPKTSKVPVRQTSQPVEEENRFLTDPYLFNEGNGHSEFRFNGW
jgi:RNA recognition motif-containing protein